MFRYCVMLIVVGFVASQAAIEFSDLKSEQAETDTAVKTVAVEVERPAVETKQSTQPLFGKSAKILADSRGHFITTARMNGRRVEVLVDTGATSVAINRTTARRLGIHLPESAFKHKVHTANGVIRAAEATIKRIEIDRVQVRNVRAMVVSDKSLDGTLLGMSFLNQLTQFQVKNGELLLRQ